MYELYPISLVGEQKSPKFAWSNRLKSEIEGGAG
jgi:hypothetical protein